MTFNDDDIEDRLGQKIFTQTLNKLIERSGKSFREIAQDNLIPESSFFDLRTGSRSYNYLRLKKIADYFAKILKDSSISLEYLVLGSDNDKKSLESQIETIKKELRKEQSDNAWKIAEMKQQLDIFGEK